MFAPGERVGSYEIVRKLGEGGMGTVFLAREPSTGREFAVKIAHPGAPATVHQRFRQEVRVTQRLQNPHLINTHDTGVHGGGEQPVPYLVMEYLVGETLAEVLEGYGKRREAMPPAELADFARQIAAGLSSAHERSIVHRDLKPSNVFVCRTGATTLVKLIDFGLALIQRETLVEETGQTMLSPPYAPPEQWTSASGVGPAADIYAFGCVLFEMATGQPPFGVDGDLRQAHAAAAAPHVNDVRKARCPGAARLPSGLARMIRRMLAKDPQQRPPLQDVIDALSQRTETISPLRLLAWLLIGAGVLGLSGAAVAMLIDGDDDDAPNLAGRCAAPADCPPDRSCHRATGKCELTADITPDPCTVADVLGPCRSGVMASVDRWVVCKQTTFKTPEVCDGQDNDCDTETDEDIPRGQMFCCGQCRSQRVCAVIRCAGPHPGPVPP